MDCEGQEQCVAGECRCGDSANSESCTEKPWAPNCYYFSNTVGSWICGCYPGPMSPISCDQNTEVCNIDSSGCIKGGKRIVLVPLKFSKNQSN